MKSILLKESGLTGPALFVHEKSVGGEYPELNAKNLPYKREVSWERLVIAPAIAFTVKNADIRFLSGFAFGLRYLLIGNIGFISFIVRIMLISIII